MGVYHDELGVLLQNILPGVLLAPEFDRIRKPFGPVPESPAGIGDVHRGADHADLFHLVERRIVGGVVDLNAALPAGVELEAHGAPRLPLDQLLRRILQSVFDLVVVDRPEDSAVVATVELLEVRGRCAAEADPHGHLDV